MDGLVGALETLRLQWRSRVHCLNVLKLIYEDKLLAMDLHPWSSRLLCISLNGFRNSNWAIRNSSMMLFANLLRHTVGSKVVTVDGSNHNRVTSEQFFSRLPQLYPYIVEELTKYGVQQQQQQQQQHRQHHHEQQQF